MSSVQSPQEQNSTSAATALPGAKVELSSFPFIKKALWIVILGMLTAFGPVCTDIYLPALPALTRDFAADPSVIQLSLTACFLGLACGQIFIGPLSDALGRRLPLCVSLVVFVISSFCCALAPDINTLIALRFVQGCAGAGGVVLCRSMACDMFMGNELTRFMALLMTVNSLAPIIGPVIGSSIISVFTWHMLFYVLTIWGIVLLIASMACLRETLPPEHREQRVSKAVTDMVLQLGDKRFLLLALALTFVLGGFFAYLAASPFVFQSIYGFSAVEYSIIFGVNAFCITVTGFLSGRLEKRIGSTRMVTGSFIVMLISGAAVIVIALLRPDSPVFICLSLLCFVSMVGSSQTPGFGIVMAARTKGAGAASGIFGVLSFVFGALMSPLVGLMGEDSMLPLGLCMFFSALVSLILFAIGLRTHHSKE